MRLLTSTEARVLGVLIEKERTVPDTYPLSLNSLVAGCNQKTSRDPVMNLTDAQVQEALDELRSLSLVTESSGAKVMRFAHNTERALKLPSQSVALLATLMLRGPQTAAELRINSERLHRFADTGSAEVFLNELAERKDEAQPFAPQALVRLLPKAPGAREARWVHLLCGEPELPAAGPASATSSSGNDDDLRDQVRVLAARVQALEDELAALKQALGT
ncbi:hypothetical protein IP84_12015 [beta proteobacterium AAP99]|nr:hypothetical protein IP84_12015 [beta proteobacterium AAP99]